MGTAFCAPAPPVGVPAGTLTTIPAEPSKPAPSTTVSPVTVFPATEAPKIAIAVIVEGGGAGAQKAVPMAGQLMADYLNESH